MSFLDETGLSYFWSKLKQKFSDLSDGVVKNNHFTPDYGKTNKVTDCLIIDTSGSYSGASMYSGYIDSPDASKLTNSPVSSGAFAATRRVYVDGFGRVTVELLESYPTTGRMWFNTYTRGSDWSGWKQHFPAADDIIDQGTSGVWRYAKYSNGVAWCYYTRYSTGINLSKAWGGVFITPDNSISSIAYPFSFAAGTIPTELVTAQAAFVGSVWLVNGTVRNTNTKTGTYDMVSGTGGSKDCNISYFVIGRWK